MAQRGGDVTTHFRFGKKVYSPIIKYGDVDFLLSFELLEALRYINWVKPDGKIVINTQEILPPSVSLGQMEYPKGVEGYLKKYFKENVHVVNGMGIAKELGNLQAQNVVLVGAFSNFFPKIKEAISSTPSRSFWRRNSMISISRHSRLEERPCSSHRGYDFTVQAFRTGRKALRGPFSFPRSLSLSCS
jgi:indolepyruvate ferredoxin oxidoreductase beta subunit